MTEPDPKDEHDRADQGSWSANQGKTEPMPPGAGDAEPGDGEDEPDAREQMDVGASHPEAPRPDKG